MPLSRNIHIQVVPSSSAAESDIIRAVVIPFGSRNTSDLARRDRFCSLFSTQASSKNSSVAKAMQRFFGSPGQKIASHLRTHFYFQMVLCANGRKARDRYRSSRATGSPPGSESLWARAVPLLLPFTEQPSAPQLPWLQRGLSLPRAQLHQPGRSSVTKPQGSHEPHPAVP